MPTISMFFGIIIAMYYQDHVPPHIHARYGDAIATFDIETGELSEGELPKAQRRMVEAWMEIHRDELRANWKLALSREQLFRIEPLR